MTCEQNNLQKKLENFKQTTKSGCFMHILQVEPSCAES